MNYQQVECYNCKETNLEIDSFIIDHKDKQVRLNCYCKNCQTSELVVFNFLGKRISLEIW